MMKTRFMTSQKPSSPSSSFEVDILSLSSDSSTGSMASPSVSSKKRASSSKQKASKKPRPLASGSLSPADMQRFWRLEQKHRYENFKSLPIIPGRVVNLKVVRLLYVNLRISPDSVELQTLVLGNRIIVNERFFEDVFGTKYSGVIPYMNETWPEVFEVTLEATTLILGKILVDSLVDLSMFTPVVINATYDSRTFSSMGYVQDNDELKTRLLGVERGLETLHDAIEKVFRLQKDTTTDVGKLHITMTGIKQEGISTVNKFTHQVDSLKGGVSFSNNDFAVSVQTYYSSLSRGMERSYNTFYGKVINTLKYFLGDR
ncbi:hypothetical protein KY289_008453 [Solanum tuberosum]|nr:hypothetical protein KY289_008453 [Solanum tuberosum]